MSREHNHLDYSASIVAFVATNAHIPLAKLWKAFRLVISNISLNEIKSSVEKNQGINLPAFDPTDVEMFVSQLRVITNFQEQIQANLLPIQLFENRSQQYIDQRTLASSIEFHEGYLFKITPPIEAFLERLKESRWAGKRNKVLSDRDCVIVHDVPSSLDSMSNIMFAISSHFRQQLDDSGFHPGTLANCYRIVGDRIDEDIRSKFSGTPFENRYDFLSLIASTVKLACAQLFYEEQGPQEFVEWCNYICRGLVPVGWEGDSLEGKLLLYELDDE